MEAARCFDPLLQAAQNARMGVLLGEAHRHRAIGPSGYRDRGTAEPWLDTSAELSEPGE